MGVEAPGVNGTVIGQRKRVRGAARQTRHALPRQSRDNPWHHNNVTPINTPATTTATAPTVAALAVSTGATKRHLTYARPQEPKFEGRRIVAHDRPPSVARPVCRGARPHVFVLRDEILHKQLPAKRVSVPTKACHKRPGV
jgi:hypothetical protein